jgi:hypothetical protein
MTDHLSGGRKRRRRKRTATEWLWLTAIALAGVVVASAVFKIG